MNKNTNNYAICVVGERFKNFSKHENVYTFKQLIDLTYRNDNLVNYHTLVIGQGLSSNEKKILELIAINKKIIYSCSNYPKANKILTHKHHKKNIIIVEPQKEEKEVNLYYSYLDIDSICDEANDHETGQHLQGMLLIEAARQIMLAVSEKFILEPEHKSKFRCSLFRVCANFFHFGFPIDLKILHLITKLDKNQTRYIVNTKTDFIQAEQLIASIEIDYILSNENRIVKKEHELAKNALKCTLERYDEETTLEQITA